MNKQTKMLRLAVMSAAAAASVGSANAALDSAVTAAITTAQGDLLALYGALTAAGVAIWIGRLIYRKFTVK
ncbi:hypothetical protein [Rhodoferax sp.]|uniref:hypothetical protein n=1 Tax=Rhodoferax sp. TaxID=50421 RepID=UPI0025FA07A0|nr:hypothetical protein [Rhodoferax sp.]